MKGLSCLAGFCSGATQGLLSIDMLSLELKMSSGTQEEKQIVNIFLIIIIGSSTPASYFLTSSTLINSPSGQCNSL